MLKDNYITVYRCSNCFKTLPTFHFHFEFIVSFCSFILIWKLIPNYASPICKRLVPILFGLRVWKLEEIFYSLWKNLIYGRIFLLNYSHRKEGFPEVTRLYTSSISFCKVFSWIVTSSFLCRSSSKLES